MHPVRQLPYGRAYDFYTSNDGNNWQLFGETVIVEPLLNPANKIISTKTAVSVDVPVTARYIRAALAVDTDDHWWRVSEIGINDAQNMLSYNRQEWFSVSELDGWAINKNMFDGNSETRWDNNMQQETGQSVFIDMGQAVVFNEIEIDSGTDYARGLKVMASPDGIEPYEEIAVYKGSEGVNKIKLEQPVTAKCLKLELTEDYSDAFRSIYELSLGNKTSTNKSSWVATTWNHGVEVEKLAIDNSLNAMWRSLGYQQSKESYTSAFLVNMGSARTISGVAINTGSEMWTYTENYQVFAWNDGEEAKLVAQGYGKHAVTYIWFEEIEAKYVWVKAAGDSDRHFVIAELDIYA